VIYTKVTANLPSNQVRDVDRTADQDHRNRQEQIAWLLEIGIAGRARLKDLEALAAQEIAKANAPRPGSTAGAEHLREHARLSGFDQQQQPERSGHPQKT
jgi:hypothetical protein